MSQAAEHISVDHVGHVAVVTFARPPSNFASVELIRDLADTLERLDGDAPRSLSPIGLCGIDCPDDCCPAPRRPEAAAGEPPPPTPTTPST